MTNCQDVRDQLCELADGEPEAIARHAEHLADCDECRDARHDAARLAAVIRAAGDDHVPRQDLAERVLAALDRNAALAARDRDAALAEPTVPEVSGVARSAAPPPIRYRSGRSVPASARRRTRR